MNSAEHPPTARGKHRAVSRVAAILEAVALAGPLSLAELTRVTDSPKSSIFGLVKGLEAVGYLRVSADTEKFELGPDLSRLVPINRVQLTNLAMASMQRIVDQFDETVMLATRVGNSQLYLASIESRQPVRYSPPPVRPHLSMPSASLKLFLAHDTPQRIDAYFEAFPVTSEVRQRLLLEIDAARDTRVSFNRGETMADFSAAAAAVLSEDGKDVLATLAIGGPASRLYDRLDEAAAMLRVEADEVERLYRHVAEVSQEYRAKATTNHRQ